jgi:uncharacterized protein with GYD domain
MRVAQLAKWALKPGRRYVVTVRHCSTNAYKGTVAVVKASGVQASFRFRWRTLCFLRYAWRRRRFFANGRFAIMRSTVMALFMYQFAYTSESWAAQIKNPENRIETVGRKVCEAAGGKFVAGWLCLGEYDAVFIADVPDIESMSAIALAVVAGGAIKSGKTTPLLSGTQGIEALKKVEKVNQVYKPAR